MEQKRNLLFDLGNVIIDIDVEGAFENLGKLFRPDASRDIIDRIILEYECGRVSSEIFINTLLSQSFRHVQALDIIEAWNSMLIGIPAHRLEMLLGVREDHQVYLLSNTNALHLEWVYRYLARVHNVTEFEKEYFHKAYYSHLIGDRKPLSSIFEYIIEDASLIPGDTLYMDDIEANLDAARDFGFNTYLVKPGEEISEFLKTKGYF